MNKKEILLGLIIAIFLALLISPFTSSWSDGLEKVAKDKGFLKKAKAQPLLTSPIPDYLWPGIENEKLATSAAGLAGTLITFGMSYAIAALLKKRKI